MAIGEIGSVIGKLTVLDRKRERKRTYCYCKCECGSKVWIRQDSLKTTRSCGCLAKETQFESNDLKDKRFGRLIAIRSTDKRAPNGSLIWECRCDCGNLKEVSSYNLERGGVSSCGCLASEVHSKSIKKAIEIHLLEHIVEGTNIPVISSANLLSTNTSGYKGVSFHNKRRKWVAQISFKGRAYNLGRYEKKEDAIKARKEAEEKYHNNFLEWYKNKL